MPNQDLALLKNTLVAEILTKDEDVARKELAFLRPRLQDFPIQDQNFGLIHFDFENKRIYD
jgi:hypothetical protein